MNGIKQPDSLAFIVVFVSYVITMANDVDMGKA